MLYIKNVSIQILSQTHALLSYEIAEVGVFQDLSSEGLKLLSGLMRYDLSMRYMAKGALSFEYLLRW